MTLLPQLRPTTRMSPSGRSHKGAKLVVLPVDVDPVAESFRYSTIAPSVVMMRTTALERLIRFYSRAGPDDGYTPGAYNSSSAVRQGEFEFSRVHSNVQNFEMSHVVSDDLTLEALHAVDH
ncbi:hypothetical protein EJB05_52714, partial [Eragrostis curvula]